MNNGMEAMSKTVEMAVEAIVSLMTSLGFKLVGAILVIIIGMKLSGFIAKRMAKGKGFSKLDVNVQSFLKSFVKIALNIVVLLSAAFILGIPTASFITMLASAGVAVGLALQGALANFAGGLLLLIFRRYKVGDYVDIAGEEGTVDAINVLYTVLITPDNRTVTLPNGTVTNSAVVNYSDRGTRRLDISFTVNSDEPCEKVRSIILYAAEHCDLILTDPKPSVKILEHKFSAPTYTLFAWCSQGDAVAATAAVKEGVRELFDREGSGIKRYSY